MLTEQQKRLALNAAATLWAIGKKKVPDQSVETALLGLSSIKDVDDAKLNELLAQAATQLHARARVAQLDREIAERNAERAGLEKIMKADQDLKDHASAIYRHLG